MNPKGLEKLWLQNPKSIGMGPIGIGNVGVISAGVRGKGEWWLWRPSRPGRRSYKSVDVIFMGRGPGVGWDAVARWGGLRGEGLRD